MGVFIQNKAGNPQPKIAQDSLGFVRPVHGLHISTENRNACVVPLDTAASCRVVQFSGKTTGAGIQLDPC